MPLRTEQFLDLDIWRPALEKYAAVTRLSVWLFDAHETLVCGPVSANPLEAIFSEHAYDPGLIADCRSRCMADSCGRPAVVVSPSYSLGMICTALRLEGDIVGTAVAGYALIDFCQPSSIERLAKEAGVPFRRLWDVVRQLQPVPDRRLVMEGELLQVLGDTLLRENHRTRQLEDTAAELRSAAASKDEFLAVLSHELRTPLTPILGWSRMLLRPGTTSAQVARGALVIQRNALLQVRLVEDLLELNRATLGKAVLHRTVQDMTDVIRSAIEAVSDAAEEKSIEVRFVDATAPVNVDADADRLQQILRNVLSNALKFSPVGGLVTVSLSDEDGRAVVSVKDSGEGIAPEFLPHAFDIFRQQEKGTRRKNAGLGIGLALVKRLIDAHQGDVSIASEGPGLGTVVTLRLPRSATEPVAAEPPAGGIAPFDMTSLRVLVVDDVADSLESCSVMLERRGATVLTAGDGVEALEVLTGRDVDLVLCDLRMPRMDGFEFLREVQRRHGDAHAPVIALSGFTGSGDHLRSAAAGFQGHVDKPFDDEHLMTAVGAAMTKRAETQLLNSKFDLR